MYEFSIQLKELLEKSQRSVRRFMIKLCVVLLILVLVIPTIIIGSGYVVAVLHPYCGGLMFGTQEPTAITLPDLRSLSQYERVLLLTGLYNISNEYYLKMTTDNVGIIRLCIVKRYFTRESACFTIGIDVESVVPCGPDMRPDCLPSVIIEHYLGAAFWHRELSSVAYTILDADSGEVRGMNLTNTNVTFSAVWFFFLGCRLYVFLEAFFFAFVFVCGFGGVAVCFLCNYPAIRKLKR